jgi:copper oxidase (laccase) domain-containing protein
VLHVGWRGLLAGIAQAALRELGDGPLNAVIGPGIGPCCYEVGEEVAGPFRERYGAEVLHGPNLDMYASTEKALYAAGCTSVERVEMCTSCHPDLFFSHRRDGARTGRQGIVARIR